MKKINFAQVIILGILMLLSSVVAHAQWDIKIDSAHRYHNTTVGIPFATHIGNRIITGGEFIMTSDDLYSTQTVRYFSHFNGTITDVSFVSPTHGFLTLEGNSIITSPDSAGIYETLDGGVTWAKVNSVGANGSYYQINMKGNKGYAFNSSSKKFAKTTDGGATWTSSTLSYNVYNMHFFTPDTGWLYNHTSTQVVYKTANGAQSWASHTPFPVKEKIKQYNDSSAYGSVGALVYHTTDKGYTWQQTNTGVVYYLADPIRLTHAVTKDTLLAKGGINGRDIYISVNGGKHFQKLFLSPTAAPTAYDQNLRPTTFFRLDNGTYVVPVVLGVGLTGVPDYYDHAIWHTNNISTLLRDNDVTLENVLLTGYNSYPECPGDYTANITFHNEGWDTLRSVDFTVFANGTPTGTYTWQGSLAPGDYLEEYPLGLVNIPNKTNVRITISASNPNGTTDENMADDTLSRDFYIDRIVGGTYTVGGTNPDFVSLQAAMDTIEAKGLCGPIVLSFRPGNYDVNKTVGSNLVLRNSGQVSITFEGETGDAREVTIGDSALGRFYLQTAMPLTFKDITFGNQSSVKQFFYNSTSGNVDTIAYLRFEGCVFKNAPSEVLLASQPMFDLYNVKALYIDSCQFYNNGHQTVRVNNGNKIFITNSEFYYNYVYLTNIADTLIVTNNRFIGDSLYGQGLAATVKSAYVVAENNYLIGRRQRLTLTGPGLSNTDNSLRFVNNALIVNYKSGSVYPALSVGGFYQPLVAHNTLISHGRYYDFKLGVANCSQPIVKNNLVVADSMGSYIFDVAGSVGMQSDYNVFYSRSATFASGNRTWAQWQALGNDANSLWLQAELDMNTAHIELTPGNQPIFTLGTPVGVDTDLEGKLRSATAPTPGAFEDKQYSNDLEAFRFLNANHICPGAYEVEVQVINRGNTDATSYQINWQADGIAQTPITVNQTLPAGDTSAFISLGSFNFTHGGSYEVTAQVLLTSSADDNTWNDTLSQEFDIRALQGTYTVGGTQPDYLYLRRAMDDAHMYGLCGEVVFELRAGNHVQPTQYAPLYLNDMPVSNDTSRLVITSEDRDSSTVTLGSQTPNGISFPFSIMSSNHIKIEHVTISSVVNIFSAAGTLELNNCKLRDVRNEERIDGIKKHNLIITHCAAAWPIEVDFIDTLIIHNLISTGTGRVISTSNYLDFQHNQFTGTTALVDIRVYGPGVFAYNHINDSRLFLGGYKANDTLLVYNNYVYGWSALRGEDIYLSVCHNTFYNNKQLTLGVISNHYFMRNNIVVNEGTVGELFNFRTLNNGLIQFISRDIDHNIYYTTNDTVFIYEGQYYYTYQSFVDTIHQNTSSAYLLPDFVDPTLGPQMNNDPNLSHQGEAIAGIMDDFEGDMRDPLNPDIGADEFSVPSVQPDIALVQVFLDGQPCASGNIYVRLQNPGTVPIDSVDIAWDINGTTGSYTWRGSLAIGAMVDSVVVGTFAFQPGINYNISATASSPNGLPDTNPTDNQGSTSLNMLAYPLLVSADTTVCLGSDVTLTVSTNGWAGFSTSWSTGQTTGSITLNGTQTVTVLVTDTFACEHRDTFDIIENSTIAIAEDVNVPDTCGAAVGALSVLVTGGQLPYTYAWSNAGNTASLANLLSGAYDVTVTDALGCTATASFNVGASTALQGPTYNLLPNTDTTVCAGSSATLTVVSAGWPGFSTSWSTGQTTDDITVSGTQTITVVVIDSFGCEHRDTLDVIESTAIAIVESLNIPDTCAAAQGTLAILTTGGQLPYTYAWSNTATTDTIVNLLPGTYGVTATDALGCTGTGSFMVGAICDSVWPGDANADGVANNYDVLQIGLAYGATGAVRPNASIVWAAQPMLDWGTLTNALDNKHADCNGDGMVDHDDTLAVQANYGLQHNKTELERLAAPEVSLTFDTDTLHVGDSTYLNVSVGSAADPIAALHGLAFSLNYNNQVLDIDWTALEWTTSFLIQQGDKLSIVHPHVASCDMAISRTDQQDVSGYGLLLRVPVKIKSGALQPNDILSESVTASGVLGITANGTEVSFSLAAADPLVLSGEVVGISLVEGMDFTMYPNPANGALYFKSGVILFDKVVVADITGKSLIEVTDFATAQPLDISQLAAGSYIVKIESNGKTAMRKLVVIRN